LTPEQKEKNMRECKTKLSEYLGDYKNLFSRDVDDQWDRKDMACKGYLTPNDAVEFVKRLKDCLVDKDRAITCRNYNLEEKMKEFDTNKDGYV
jgi:hypothetical protein